MSDMTLVPPTSGAKAYARLGQRRPPQDERPAPRQGAAQPVRRSGAEARLAEARAAASQARAAAVPAPAAVAAPTTVGELLEFDLRFLARWVRLGSKWIIIAAITGMIAAFGFSVLSKPRYTASAALIVDPSNLQVVSEDLFPARQQPDTQLAAVESKLQLLYSGNVLTRVVEDLSLQDDEEFVPREPPLFFAGAGEHQGSPLQVAVRSLAKRVKAVRVDKTFVVSLSVWTEDPDKSVTVANAMIDAFKSELAASDAAGAKRAAGSLHGRLDELRREVNEAEERVENFRRQHGLQTSSGELLSSQSLTQLTARRNEAQVRLAEAESRYDELQAAARAGGITNQALSSPTISALRQQYSSIKQQADSAAVTLGPRHPTLATLRSQVASIEAEIASEMDRLLRAARSDLEESRAVVAALGAEADTVRQAVATDNDAQIQLRQLERDAAAQAAVFEAFLSRTVEVTEREWIDSTNVRVISEPVPPEGRSYPPRLVILLMLGAIGGALVGTGIALVLGWRRSA